MQDANELKINQKNTITYEALYMPIILILTLILYWQTLSFDFVYDDVGLIVENNYINGNDFTNIWDAFKPGFVMTAIYTPLTFLFYTLLFHISNGTPLIFHISALFIYLISICLLYVLLKKFLNNDLIAFWAALLYALHPAHVENTAWVSAAGYNLAACFAFASFSLFIDILRDDSKTKYPVRFILFLFTSICSVLCQPAATVFPVLFLLYACCFVKDKFAKALKLSILPFIFSSCSVFLFVLTIEQSASKLTRFNVTVHHSIFHKIQAAGRYLFNAFIPYDLMPIYSASDNFFYTVFILLCLILILILFFKHQKSLFVFLCLWFFISASPYLNIFYPISHLMNDRYLLFPSVASCLALSAVCLTFCRWLEQKFFLLRYVPIVVISLFYFLSLWTYLPVWSSNLSLWGYSYSKNSTNYFVMKSYAAALYTARLYDELYLFSEKITEQQFYDLKFNILMSCGRLKEAKIYEGEIKESNDIQTQLYLAYLYLSEYQSGKALDVINRLNERQVPSYLSVKFIAISYNVYYRNGMIDDALAFIPSILKRQKNCSVLIPDTFDLSSASDITVLKENCLSYLKGQPDPEASSYIAKFLHMVFLREKYGLSQSCDVLKRGHEKNLMALEVLNKGKDNEAEVLWVDILREDPYSEEANSNLGMMYFRQKKYRDSIKYLTAAYEKNPSRGEILELINKCRVKIK